MNSGSNHPATNGGRGRKRRRGRRGGQGAGAQTALQNSNPAQIDAGQSNQTPSQASQGKQALQGKPVMKRQFKPKPPARKNFTADANGNGNGNGSSSKRVFRSVVNQKTPDAGIYSAPMDHSYRSLQHEGNSGRPGYEAMPVIDNSMSKPIFAFVDDLFFMAKIQETARKLNVKVDFVKSDKEVLELVASGEEKPSLIIIDLNHHTVKPLTVIPKLKSKFKKETNIIGFLSHLQGELKMKAQEAGCDMVLPRSAFSQNLPQLLRRHATSEAELQEY
jgi:CheY-like chemotaxis protein